MPGTAYVQLKYSNSFQPAQGRTGQDRAGYSKQQSPPPVKSTILLHEVDRSQSLEMQALRLAVSLQLLRPSPFSFFLPCKLSNTLRPPIPLSDLANAEY